jgi:hypothetical protein
MSKTAKILTIAFWILMTPFSVMGFYLMLHPPPPAPLTKEQIAVNARVAAIDDHIQELQDERDQLDPPDDPEEGREPPDNGWDLD